MTTVFIDAQGDIDPAIANGYFPPVADGCIGLFDLSTAGVADGKVLNLVNPAASAIIVGNPTIAADGITMTGLVNYLQTLQLETEEFTLMSLGRSISAGHNMISTFGAEFANGTGSDIGSSIFAGVNGTFPQQNISSGFSLIDTVAGTRRVALRPILVPDTTVPLCVSASYTVATKLYEQTIHTTGARAFATATANEQRFLRAAPFAWRIGSSYKGTGGEWKGRFAAIYNRALTAAEKTTMSDFLRSEAGAGW